MVSETDLHGNTTSLTYNSSGQLTQITSLSGRSLALAYNSAGQLASVTDPLGREATYTYDSAGDLTQVDDPGGRDWEYTYDADHNLLTIEDPRGNTVLTNTYNSQDQVTQQVDALGRTTTWSYTQTDANDSETVVTLPNGSVTDYTFQDDEPVTTVTAEGSSDQVTTSATYNTAGELATGTNGNGGVTSYTYDGDGTMLTETDPMGHETTWTYNSANQVTSATLPSGAETTYTYDSHGNLTAESQVPAPGATSPSGDLTTNYAYTDSAFPSLPTSMTDPNGKTTTYTYDSDGDLASTTQPDGEDTTYGYDADGEQTKVTSPEGNTPPNSPTAYTTTTTYNAAGQPLTVTDPMGNVTTYTYDLDGNKTSVENAALKTTTYTYDADNELTKTTNPDGDTTQKSYNSMGNVATETDGNGNVTTDTYNAQDELSSVETAMSQTTSYTYDADGNRLTTTDPQSRVTTDTYNADDELTGVSYSSGTPSDVSYTYTPDGQVATMVDGTGTTTYTYDGVDRLISVKDGAGNTVSYTLDADGNETGITYPNGKTVTYAFNGDDQMTSLTDWSSRKTTFSYDPDGNLTSTVDGDTVSTTDTNTYNADDELMSIAGTQGTTSLYGISYTRTNLGQVASETDTGITGATDPSYTYNGDGQMTGATTAAPTAWVYDDAGNPTTESGSTGFEYNADDQLTSAGGISYTYSADGDERTADTWSAATESYAYDQAGNLTEVSHPAYGTEAALTVTQAYDGNGLMQSFTQNGTLHTLTWDVSGSQPLLLQESSTDYVYGPDGRPVEQIQGSSAYFFHLDQQNSMRLLTNASGGAVVDSYTYNPYGKIVADSGSQTVRLTWDGEFYESATNLYTMGARSYDPTTEQFMSRDPLAQETMQPYEYAGDDPVDGADPSGLFSVGYCPLVLTGLIGDIVGGTASGCIQVTTGGDLGVTGTVGPTDGIGTPGGDFGEGFEFSNADHIWQLAGKFDEAGGNADIFGGAFGSTFTGDDSCGERIAGAMVGPSVGVGGYVYTGPTDTWQASVNVVSLVKHDLFEPLADLSSELNPFG